MKKRKIVCFGGGNGLPKAVLCELKKYPFEITTITSMVDSGGSSGQLKKDFNVLPPGDLRRHLLALSSAPSWKKELFSFRFGHEKFPGGHKGHCFGNVFLAGLEYVLRDYKKVLKIAHQFLEVKGKCYPATIEKTELWAILENGQIICGEDEIDVPKKHSPSLSIKKVFLRPKVKAFKEAVLEIKKAEIIIIGPGDLFSSILPCFLPQGIKEAILKSQAKKILICPAMTKKGETKNFSVKDFAKEVEKYIASSLDFVVFNTRFPSSKRIKLHQKKEPSHLSMVRINKDLDKRKFIGEDLLLEKGEIFYDPKKVMKLLLKIFKKI